MTIGESLLPDRSPGCPYLSSGTRRPGRRLHPFCRAEGNLLCSELNFDLFPSVSPKASVQRRQPEEAILTHKWGSHTDSAPSPEFRRSVSAPFPAWNQTPENFTSRLTTRPNPGRPARTEHLHASRSSSKGLIKDLWRVHLPHPLSFCHVPQNPAATIVQLLWRKLRSGVLHEHPGRYRSSFGC